MLSTYAGNEEAVLSEVRSLILEGTLRPVERRDCVVCDDLGCEFCPHILGGEDDA